MNTFGPDSSRISSRSGEARPEPKQDKRLQDARSRVKAALSGANSKESAAEEYDTPATVRSIGSAPSKRSERAAAEAIESDKAARLERARAALEGPKAQVDAEGDVVDMAKYRRVQEALEAVDLAHETMPMSEPVQQIEDLLTE